MKKITVLILVMIFALASCAPFTQSKAEPGVTEKPTDVFSPPGPTNTEVTKPTEPQPTPVMPMADMAKPGMPGQAVMQAMSAKYGVKMADIQIIKSQPMSWPTGCLGIVLPGVLCTKGPVDGFSVTMVANGKQYEFHTNKDGTNIIDAAQQLASIQLVVYGANQAVSLVNPDIALGPTYNPAFNGFLPSGGEANGTAYVLSFANGTKAFALDASGTRELNFVKNANYGLAVWPGGEGVQPRLAWGTQPMDASNPSTLVMSNADGSQMETLVTGETNPNPPVQLVAEFWSADGQFVYFSKEPYGIGGYINFAGGSSLYKINVATKEVTSLIEWSAAGHQMVCLDAISGDFRYVVDHCALKTLTIRDLSDGKVTATIQPPAEVNGYNFVGGGRFSPDGKAVAFAMAKGDPSNEQGWLALADSASGNSKLISTGQAGTYFSVHGWLDDQTLLVESHGLQCNPTCSNELWTIRTDGSKLTKVAEGSLLTVLDNR